MTAPIAPTPTAQERAEALLETLGGAWNPRQITAILAYGAEREREGYERAAGVFDALAAENMTHLMNGYRVADRIRALALAGPQAPSPTTKESP